MKEAYYFSHDSNARNDPKIRALRKQYGIAGYGLYWIIIEMLRESAEYKLPFKPYILDCLSEELGDDATDVQQLLNDLIAKFELLQSDGSYFWSDSLRKRMESYDSKREQSRRAGLKSAAQRERGASGATAPERPLNGRSTRKGKESKANQANKSKEKDHGDHHQPACAPETDAAVSQVVTEYQQQINPSASPLEIEKILAWLNDFPDDVIVKAMEIAVSNNKRNLAYIEAILRNWSKENLRTLTAIQCHERERESRKDQSKIRAAPSRPGSSLEYLRKRMEEAERDDRSGNHETNLHGLDGIPVEARVVRAADG